MKNILLLLLSVIIISACSAPKPTKISFTRNMKPVNFNDDIADSNIVIKSSQVQSDFSKQFAFFLENTHEYSPLFYYYISHADKIVAHIKPPFVEFVYEQTQAWLMKHGVSASIHLIIEKNNKLAPQVILECIKY